MNTRAMELSQQIKYFRTQVQISRTHMKAREVWWPSVNSALGRQRWGYLEQAAWVDWLQGESSRRSERIKFNN